MYMNIYRRKNLVCSLIKGKLLQDFLISFFKSKPTASDWPLREGGKIIVFNSAIQDIENDAEV